MLRAALVPRSQPAALNCLLISKRWQRAPGSPSTTSSTAKPVSAAATSTSTTTNSTTSAKSTSYDGTSKATNYPTSKIVPSSARTGAPPGYPRPPTKKSGGAIKAVIYGVAFGLTATLIYAEYENGSFRRQLESTIPYASDVLGGLDQFVDPIFGRQKGLAGTVTGDFPNLAIVKKDDASKTLGDQAKAAADTIKEKLPDSKKVKDAISHASDQVILRWPFNAQNRLNLS